MEHSKVEQIRDKICDHMLNVDLSKLSMYDLNQYINAYKTLEGWSPFQGFALSGFGANNVSSTATPTPV